jgi:hypothetical protein
LDSSEWLDPHAVEGVNMADAAVCQECERLREASRQAHRDWTFYRPMHSGYRPQSRWSKADREARTALERAYNLAEAKYQLHHAEHMDNPDGRDVARNLSTVIRGGRLKP